jgi:hypothetical protein
MTITPKEVRKAIGTLAIFLWGIFLINGFLTSRIAFPRGLHTVIQKPSGSIDTAGIHGTQDGRVEDLVNEMLQLHRAGAKISNEYLYDQATNPLRTQMWFWASLMVLYVSSFVWQWCVRPRA